MKLSVQIELNIMFHSGVMAKNGMSKIRQLLHRKNSIKRCIIVFLQYPSRDIFNECSDMERLKLNLTFKALNYAVLHLSLTKLSERSFEVGFATGYGLVMKHKVVTWGKRTHNSTQKYCYFS